MGCKQHLMVTRKILVMGNCMTRCDEMKEIQSL